LSEAQIESLKKAILYLYGCDSTWLESVSVTETFEDHLVWTGAVQVFELHGHPTASKCYAWSSAIEGTIQRKFYAVLHVPPVDSPAAAVKASVGQDHRTKLGGRGLDD
jgi:hypothetical protein